MVISLGTRLFVIFYPLIYKLKQSLKEYYSHSTLIAMNHSLTRTNNRFFEASLESEYLSLTQFQVTP